jgi:hypothetical protein
MNNYTQSASTQVSETEGSVLGCLVRALNSCLVFVFSQIRIGAGENDKFLAVKPHVAFEDYLKA